MKRVLYIGGFELPDKNAAAQRVLSNAKLLREMGFDVSFIGISKDLSNAPTEVCGFSSTPVPYPTKLREWVRHIIRFVDPEAILSREPDYVILYNFPSIASLRILNLCHKHSSQVIEDITEWEEPLGMSMRSIIRRVDVKARMEYCVKKMDGVITISRYLYNKYSPHTKTILVPPTVDITDSKWVGCFEDSVDEIISLVYAGNAGYGIKDRLDYVLEALEGVNNVRLTVIGMTKGQYESGYHKAVPDSVEVSFLGRIPHQEAILAVKKADFQMLIRDNSRKNNAGFPTKLVESMACGTPVIATLTSNIGDYLKDGYNCFLVSERKQLKDIIVELSKLSRSKIAEMKQHCKESFCFDYHCFMSEFRKLFK